MTSITVKILTEDIRTLTIPLLEVTNKNNIPDARGTFTIDIQIGVLPTIYSFKVRGGTQLTGSDADFYALYGSAKNGTFTQSQPNLIEFDDGVGNYKYYFTFFRVAGIPPTLQILSDVGFPGDLPSSYVSVTVTRCY